MTTGFSLKDQLFNRERVDYLAAQFEASNAGFDRRGFVSDVMKQLTELELKQRIVHIAISLEKYLAPDFPTAARQILAALPPPLDPSRVDDDFGDFIFAALGQYVVHHGNNKKQLPLSLATLKELTQRFSMEDAIRAFINAYPAETLRELAEWATDVNYHVRRLVSEGTRPLLPWSGRLAIEPTLSLPLLDTLHADPTRYVTRSVSNHLNDLSKREASLVISILKKWRQQGRQRPEELQWMTKHALRTLVKQGHVDALKLLGFRSQPKIEVTEFTVTPASVRPGGAIVLEFTVTALRDETLLIDYVIDFVKAHGKLSPKVHKLKQLHISCGQTIKLRKSHPLRAAATTFTLYPGQHRVSLQINGKIWSRQNFQLEMKQ